MRTVHEIIIILCVGFALTFAFLSQRLNNAKRFEQVMHEILEIETLRSALAKAHHVPRHMIVIGKIKNPK